MSAMGDDDHELNSFHTTMKDFHRYPYNLSLRHTTEKIKFVGDFRQHFDQTKDYILLVLNQNVKGFRRKLIEKKIRVEFHDAGLRDASSDSSSMTPPGQPPITAGSSCIPRLQYGESSASSWDHKDDTDVYVVSNSKDFEAAFRISSLSPVRDPAIKSRADPVCRFIFLATSAPNARRLKITEELLLKILTYHQVSPCFLNFISYFGHEPLSGAGDLFFGGFRSLRSFSEPMFNLKALDRSGYHYQLAFEFRTLFRPSSQDTGYADRQPGEREVLDEHIDDELGGLGRANNNTGTVWRLLPSWLRPRDDGVGDEAATEFTAQTTDDPDLWPVDQCAIYHHFDVENGKSLWMMTAAEGEGQKPPPGGADTASEFKAGQGFSFRDVKGARFSVNILSSSPIEERFGASLSVLLWLADWSLSDYGHYVTMLDDDLQKLTRPYIEVMGDGGPVPEIGLKKLNRYMEKLDEIVVALQGNLRVCRAIAKFYRDELLQDRKFRALDLAWTTDKESRAKVREHLDDFQDKLRWVCTSTQEMLRRAVVVKQVGVRRENAVHRLLQNRDVRTTNELAKVTNKDSSTMRVFSAITLILLPVSVVSTIFSAGIVDFANGTGGFAGSWSGPAALWWAGMTIVLTGFVRVAGERWRQRAIAAAAVGNTKKNKFPGAASDHESWTTQVRRAINDARVHAQPFKHWIRVRYARVVASLKKSLVRVHSRRAPSGPAGYPPPNPPCPEDRYPQVVGSRGQLPASPSSLSVISARASPPPVELEGKRQGSIHVIEDGESGPSDHASPQELPAQSPAGFGAIAGSESGELRSKPFDQASTAEQGLVRVTLSNKEKHQVSNETEGQEK